jgi:hypothetical protein
MNHLRLGCLQWVLVVGCDAGELVGAGDSQEGSEDTSAAAAAEEVPDPLQSKSFAWCHQAQRDVSDVVPWCSLLKDLPEEVCPGMRQTCAQPDLSVRSEGCASGGRSGASGRLAGKPGAPDPDVTLPNFDWEGLDCALDYSLSGWAALLRWAQALAVAALIVAVSWFIARQLGWRRLTPAGAPVATVLVEPLPVQGIEGDDDLPALPEEALLVRAQQALEAGLLGEAVVFARGAALRRLARRGLLRLHRARTDREYLRAVGGQGEAVDALREVLRAVEDHRWAHRVLSIDQARAAITAAARILAMACWALVVLPAQASDARYGPNGDVAVARLLEQVGYEVVEAPGSLHELDATVDVVVLDLYGVAPEEEDWEALRAWMEAGGVLVVGGDPSLSASLWGAPGPRRMFTRIGPELGFTELGARLRLPLPVWPGGPTYEFCSDPAFALVVPTGDRFVTAAAAPEETLEDPDWGCVSSVVTAAPRGTGWLIAISDPRVLWNVAMVHPDNRAFLSGLLLSGRRAGLWHLPKDARVVLALISVSGQAPPTGPLANAKLQPFVLQLLVLWGIVVAWRGWRMGPLRDPEVAGRDAFVLHVHALARRWGSVGGTRVAASAYARLWWQRLGATGLELAALRHGADRDEARRFVARVERLAGQSAGAVEDEDLELVEALWKTTRPR